MAKSQQTDMVFFWYNPFCYDFFGMGIKLTLVTRFCTEIELIVGQRWTLKKMDQFVQSVGSSRLARCIRPLGDRKSMVGRWFRMTIVDTG